MPQSKDPLYRKYGSLLFLLAIGMMLCVYTVTNKVVVGVCATLLTGLFGWAFYEIQTNKNATGSAKKTSWFFLIVMIAILYIAYAKLTGVWEPR